MTPLTTTEDRSTAREPPEASTRGRGLAVSAFLVPRLVCDEFQTSETPALSSVPEALPPATRTSATDAHFAPRPDPAYPAGRARANPSPTPPNPAPPIRPPPPARIRRPPPVGRGRHPPAPSSRGSLSSGVWGGP